MRSSSDENDSFMEAAGSDHFNNPPSDPDIPQQMGSGSSSMPPQDSERNEDICFDNPPSNPRISSSSIRSQERTEVT